MWERFGFRPYETEQMDEKDIYGFILIDEIKGEEYIRKKELEEAKRELRIK